LAWPGEITVGELDLTLYRLLDRDFGPAVDNAVRLLSSREFGLLVLAVVVLGAFLRWGRKGLWLGLPLLVAVGLTDVVGARILKPLVDRPRPIDILPPGTFRQLVEVAHGGSMPSLHASNAFSAAAFLWLVRPSLGAPALVLAMLIALSRVVGGVHWPTDILAGALLGTLVSVAVVIGINRGRSARGEPPLEVLFARWRPERISRGASP
jgi:undecaprenyl-diphosphatase